VEVSDLEQCDGLVVLFEVLGLAGHGVDLLDGVGVSNERGSLVENGVIGSDWLRMVQIYTISVQLICLFVWRFVCMLR
jgi:hypothetical protein